MDKNVRKYLLKVVHGLTDVIPDRKYLEWSYYLEMNKKLNLDNPQTMNEKLQWLKLNNHNPELTDMVDKLRVKDIVSKRLGPDFVAPVLQVWDSVEDVDITDLPDQFVLKTNHSGGNTGVVICKDKSKFSIDDAKQKLSNAWKLDLNRRYREWPYKNIKKKVFAEKYLGDNLSDYKFYCFNGYVDCCLVCVGRQEGNTKFYFFDKDWVRKKYNKSSLTVPEDFTLPKPANYEKMIEVAAELSKGLPIVRMDLFDVDGNIYFGEFTFYPGSGFDANRLPPADLYFGKMVDLSMVKDAPQHKK